jgi:hypothetical protein
MAIGSCEPEAAHSAALPVREPHSVPQTADRRESRRRCSPPLTIPTRSGRPVVYHAAVTALRPPDAPVTSSCELGAARNAAPRARRPHSTPQRAERRDSRQRRYIASGHDHPQQASRRAPRGRDGPKAVRRSGHQLVRARSRTQRCPPSERASQRAAARRSAQVAARVVRGVTVAPTHLPPEGVLPRSTRQGRPLRPPGALAVSLCSHKPRPALLSMQESLTARRSTQSAARGARGVTSPPALLTLSKVLPRSARQGRS